MPIAETLTRVTIKLSDEVAQAYEASALKRKVTLEKELVDRLTRCKAHTAVQGLYFDDAERQELIHITGGHLLPTAQDALNRIKTTMSVAFGDIKLDIDQRLAQRIYSRAKACRMTPEEWIKREGLRSVKEACGML